jgi:type VI secretion system protein ImpG
MILNRYYEAELANLRETAVAFSRAHPAIAPMLAGASSDPDVERLLEGVAFLTGMVRQKLDDEFPEFIQELAHLLFPHYLRPIPSATMIAFAPKAKLSERATVAAGVAISSQPVDGTPCVFRTCFNVDVDPLAIAQMQLVDTPGTQPTIRIRFDTGGLDVSALKTESIRLFLGSSYTEAANLFLLLSRHVERIVVSAAGGTALVLEPEALVPAGFDPRQVLIPYPSHAFPGYRLLQEYFVLPEKFLFLDLQGLSRWRDRGSARAFEVEFRLSSLPDWMPELRSDSIMLNVTPALNVFTHNADPIQLDHKRPEYRVLPSGNNKGHFQIYSIDEVIGFEQGVTAQKVYRPFGMFRGESSASAATYQLQRRAAAVNAGADVFLSIAYRPDEVPRDQTLSMKITCTNGALPESLRLGDISKPTDSSPERLTFRNIRTPTAHLQPPAGEGLLWRLLSHLSINFLSVATREHLCSLLQLYLFADRSERGSDAANQRRIDSIVDVQVAASSRLVAGTLIRGRTVTIECRSDGFASLGDMFLFGCVLEQFLGCYASINSFTRCELRDTLTGETFRWPERVGQQPLI